MLRINSYLRPKSIEEAYNELNSEGNNVVLGGGAYLRLGNRKIDKAIDLYGLNLNYIMEYDDFIEIGAMTTLREVETSEILKNNFDGIVNKAASVIMGVQLRNVATVGGTVGGRYGFSDFLTALLSLDTTVELFKKGEVSLEEFLSSSQTSRDIITKIKINKSITKASFKDLRNTATDFSILNVAVSKNVDNFKIVVGSRPGVATLAYKSMNLINSSQNPNENIDNLCNSLVEELKLGSDLRASVAYRKEVAKVLVKRALMEVL